ncbi:MAG: iron ABC transporter permease [Synergistales bacterium]|nr:iron ABC transporter permease [Synergistales bacterium]MDY6401499.1 iron ABC transporter permease [Synergistales bacterium]MDY6404606.1 iron ABC transporter permease [Synergistales bacterium]MDY6410509.1 iron ABC transporter permease [Synergistales bacterium]MDY6414686.1 iron ABC transporter permease [Synergistales bacterium]
MNKRFINFLLTLLFVILVGTWIYTSVRDEFLKQSRTAQRRTVETVAAGYPEPEDVDDWLKRLADEAREYSVVFVSEIPMPGEKLNAAPKGDKELAELTEKSALDPEFSKGFDNAAYEEIYRASNNWTVGTKEEQAIFFAPAVSLKTHEIEGALVFAFNTEGEQNFMRMLNTLFFGAFILFAVVIWQLMLSRDPIVGFALAGLFLMTLVFVAYPLFEALRLSFVENGKFSLSIWKTILNSEGYLSALWGSLKLGCWTATFSTIVGFLFAFVVARTNAPCKKLISTMGVLPVISPPFSLTLSIILLFGNNGLITRWLRVIGLDFSIYGLPGLVIVQTMGMFPIAFLTLSGVLQAIDSTYEEASLNLSAGRFKTFSSITFPLAVPGLLSSWLLVFTTSLADFANPLLLAGDLKVLSLESYIEVTGMNRLGHGAALSILLLLPTLTAFLAQRFWVSKRSYVTVTGKPSGRITELTTPLVRRILTGIIFVIVFLLILLYGTIFAGCFVKNWGIDYTFSLENITEAVTRSRDALLDTVTLAAIATPIAGITAMIAALLIIRRKFHGKRLLEMLLMTPFALPGTLVGISYILAFNHAPIILVGTAAIIIINYVIRELPVGIEGGIASLRQIDPSIEEAATDLGADQATVFRTIVLPLVRPAFLSSLSYTFVRSMTAVSAVIFLISAKWYHLTVLIYNFSENLRFGLASVLSTVLIIIVFSAFGLMRLLVRENVNLMKSVN